MKNKKFKFVSGMVLADGICSGCGKNLAKPFEVREIKGITPGRVLEFHCKCKTKTYQWQDDFKIKE